jgi:hypothetical protein
MIILKFAFGGVFCPIDMALKIYLLLKFIKLIFLNLRFIPNRHA